MSVLKTVRAFEEQYLMSAFLNFKRLCYFCFKVRIFDFTLKSRFSQKKWGCAKTQFFGFLGEKKTEFCLKNFLPRKKIISITLRKHENQF